MRKLEQEFNNRKNLPEQNLSGYLIKSVAFGRVFPCAHWAQIRLSLMVGQKVLLTDKTGHAPPFRCLDVDRLDVTDPGQCVLKRGRKC